MHTNKLVVSTGCTRIEMKFDSLRIRNFRTLGSEQFVDLSNGLTIVGPNSSGKTNILKAIEMIFTGYDNVLEYEAKRDLTFGITSGQTSLVASFSHSESVFFPTLRLIDSIIESHSAIVGFVVISS